MNAREWQAAQRDGRANRELVRDVMLVSGLALTAIAILLAMVVA